MPTSGGYRKQISTAQELQAETVQVFLGSPSSWSLGRFEPETLIQGAELAATAGIDPIIPHASYLINMAGSDPQNYEKSRNLLQDSLQRTAVLKAPYLVVHVGSHGGAGLTIGLQRILAMLELLQLDWPQGVMMLLENTAGSGRTIGNIAEIGMIIKEAGEPPWLGVCFDTCHAWEYGYNVQNRPGWQQTLELFDHHIGLKHLKALHVNDSKTAQASRVDRHEHLGEGTIGLECFQTMVTLAELQNLPWILETPDQGDFSGYRKDLELLRSLRETL